jgi:hypothetical protein
MLEIRRSGKAAVVDRGCSRKRLYAVNARFGTATAADQHYDVVKVG